MALLLTASLISSMPHRSVPTSWFQRHTDTPTLHFRIQSGRDTYLHGVPLDPLHGLQTCKLACPLYHLHIPLCLRPRKIRQAVG